MTVMIKQWLAYFMVRVVICVLQTLPMETCETLAHAVAHLAYDVLKIRRAIIDDNLAHAFPQQTPAQRRQLALGTWQHMFLMICELSQVPRKLHDTNWRQHIEISRPEIELFIRQLLSPRPIVVVSGHFGNFEVGGITAGLLGFPTFTVARPLDNIYLHRFLTRFRQATGQFMLPKQGSAKQLDAILQSGGTMMLLGDQSAGPKGVWVEFFGRPASCHKAVALFSLVNRAPMLFAYTVRVRPLKFRVGLSAVFDPLTDSDLSGVKRLTQWYNDQLERAVRQYPGQYWWLHNRWKNKPAWRLLRRMKQRKLAGPHRTPDRRDGPERTAETESRSRRFDR
jgi:KDO2-lipid IV(A) lauroyltransferase